MPLHPFTWRSLLRALRQGWLQFVGLRSISAAYSLVFVLGGVLIFGAVLSQGWTPFLIPAAGAFMLVGPVVLAGFFGLASAQASGLATGWAAIGHGFRSAAPGLWALALVCGLLFMIFVTDAAILYAYMIGGSPVWLRGVLPESARIVDFVLWASVSGGVIAFLLFAISAFAVPLLCERRASLVGAVACSVRAVFGSFFPAMGWALLLSVVIIASVWLLPLLLVTLPWLAFASRALYREVLPN